MGFTCAACHTAQINLGGVPTVIDGAQALGDFQGFLKGLDDAMISTHESPEKFARFADSVLGQDRTAEETQALKNYWDFLALLAFPIQLILFQMN